MPTALEKARDHARAVERLALHAEADERLVAQLLMEALDSYEFPGTDYRWKVAQAIAANIRAAYF